MKRLSWLSVFYSDVISANSELIQKAKDSCFIQSGYISFETENESHFLVGKDGNFVKNKFQPSTTNSPQ